MFSTNARCRSECNVTLFGRDVNFSMGMRCIIESIFVVNDIIELYIFIYAVQVSCCIIRECIISIKY